MHARKFWRETRSFDQAILRHFPAIKPTSAGWLYKETRYIGPQLLHVAELTSNERIFFCENVARLAATVLLPQVGPQNVRALLDVVDEIFTRAHLFLPSDMPLADLQDEFLERATQPIAAETALACFMLKWWECKAPGAAAA